MAISLKSEFQKKENPLSITILYLHHCILAPSLTWPDIHTFLLLACTKLMQRDAAH